MALSPCHATPVSLLVQAREERRPRVAPGRKGLAPIGGGPNRALD
jgi:hypothetical protein